MALGSFHTHIIGADKAVGQSLSRLLSENNYIFKGISLDNRDRLALQSSGRPFFVLTPDLQLESLSQIKDWIDIAQQQDAGLFLLSSLLVETSDRYLTPEQQKIKAALLDIEAWVQQVTNHLILRAGPIFSLQAGDFPSRILHCVRNEQPLNLDNKHVFAPTPASDLADIFLAVLKQCHCSDQLWGTYHFNGTEPITQFDFARQLLADASCYEEFSPTATQDIHATEVELGDGDFFTAKQESSGHSSEITSVIEPYISVCNEVGLFHSFGIKNKPWRDGVKTLLKQLYLSDR